MIVLVLIWVYTTSLFHFSTDDFQLFQIAFPSQIYNKTKIKKKLISETKSNH